MAAGAGEKAAVIVTGASRGIGAAIAERLAGNGYGVVVNYAVDADGAESVVSGIAGAGGAAVAVRADVASADDVEAMFGRVREQMGPLTALVNNAGALGQKARIDDQHEDALTRLMQLNVVGPMLCAKHAGHVDRAWGKRRIDRDDRIARCPSSARNRGRGPLRGDQGRYGDVRARPVQGGRI